MAQVQLKNVYKTYDGRHSVDDLSLTVEDREFMVLVGPSGCGKSTTLRMISGLEPTSSGQIFIDGKDVTDVAPQNRDIAMVFQSYALYPHMTAYKNMSFGLQRSTNLSKIEIDKRIQEAAEILNIRDLLMRRPAEMSGGERQRVAIGRALVRKPKVYLFDEPLSNLDAKLRHKMRAEMKRLHSELGITVIYVTHDQVEAMTLGSRISIMSKGVLQQVGRPMDLYKTPANTFVASFIGSPEMTLLSSDTANGLFENGGIPQNALAGIRPEEFLIVGPDHMGALQANIEAIEYIGSEALIYAKTNGEDLTIRCSVAQAERSGQDQGLIHVALDGKTQRFFDPTTGSVL